MGNPTIGEMINRAAEHLRASGSETPRLDAEVLLAHALGRDRVYLFRETGRTLPEEIARRYRALIERRVAGEPVAYLTGSKEFMGLDFLVGSHVLIPRPETELMVEYALAALAGWPGSRRIVADVGTGSGAVAVSLARLAPGVQVYATDISEQALATARANAGRHGVDVQFYCGDLLSPLQGVLGPASVAVITANLPYIPSPEMSGLPRDVRCFEPALALDGGSDGLALYRRLVPGAYSLLAPGGYLLMEIAPDQGDRALELTPPPRWRARVLRDLAGRPRLVAAQKFE
ncbi:peptide chain release factor N(5)-glutamine methyltransferase [Desulfoscipio geothermicus]|uniref:Release factor glutamine methyltransferase n=1 Tax=Desulfoscipio geothermicus DSM 3669 TaxID=1121426 RepID=A0A1I6CYM2_9FIRM|nr:peptide chain release factor N(5)-glutamine methyltransferase [Desulfoscipio geothermicus]SFQ98220.1 release factor glutamine methyltransferase [Desulfoscipio geothermicus DSM 3669]